MKIQNLFNVGTIDKDSDSRFVAEGKLIDAENFFVNTLESSGGGVGKNALGNALKTAYNITGGKTIGHGVNTSTNKVYNFIKGTNHDYIIEYDSETFASEIVAQSTPNARLNFKTGERITNVDVIVSGIPYDSLTQEGGDLLAFSGDSNPPRILNINRWKDNHTKVDFGINWFTAEEIMLIKAPPLYPVIVAQITTSAKENFLAEKFISFAYRYQYKDGYYSAIASWQAYSFTPGKFDLDFATFENKGMVNIFNACDVSFNTGAREVSGIELLFKESNSSTVYKIDKYIKLEELWGDNTTQTIRFDNSKIYTVLPEEQYFRSYDNVPEECIAQSFAGNRQIYANYKENKDLVDVNGDRIVIDYNVGLVSTSNQSIEAVKTKLTSISSFDASSITDGKIRIDYTGLSLVKGAFLGVYFDIKSIAIPDRSITTFKNTYNTILSSDYASIQLLVEDTANGFKSGIEGYLTDLFAGDLTWPTDSLAFPPSLFNGFTVSVISTNVIEIVLPSMKYEIEVLPSGPNTFVMEYMQDSNTVSGIESIGVKTSMHSYRSYEVCQIYRDAQGRKTTALTSTSNTVSVPLENSVLQNKIQITIPPSQKPPKWATTYKFGIKENKGTYEEVYASIFYKDGVYRWIKLDGTNKNKVKEGDTLLVKRDIYAPLSNPSFVKVLEVKLQESDFITGNLDSLGSPIVEAAGLYMKIKPGNISIDYSPGDFKNFEDHRAALNGTPKSTIDITGAITEGSTISFDLHSDYHRAFDFNDYKKEFIANANYASFQAFFNAQLSDVSFLGTGAGRVFPKQMNSSSVLEITGTSSGVNSWADRRGFLDVKITVRTISGYMIFETESQEIENAIYYETPEVYDIIANNHQQSVHLLNKTFNCYVQGNGGEGHQIKDAFNAKYISLDFSPTAISQDGYKQIDRFADITYSGVYNSNTNVNRLNEFNLYLANFKEDIEKSYGPIIKIKGTDSNLVVRQEDKNSVVFYGKDLLYNADGTSNLTKIESVLGQQQMKAGEYGISYHAESEDEYGTNAYFTDTKRGVVLKDNFNNGLFEISSQGMNSYFKKLFRDNVIDQIIGEYDQYHDVYVLNVKYNSGSYVTWVYSDKDNGWLGRITFNPEDMCRVNGKFLSFYEGEVYEHNNNAVRNTFFGVETPSTFTVNFPQEPSSRKNYKTIEIEGTDAWDLTINTDLDSGYINAVDFNKEEGVYKAHTRLSNDVIDTSLLSVQGIGNCTVAGFILSFGFNLSSDVSIGDDVRNLSNQLVGTILSKTPNSLTLNAVENIVSGDFVMLSKPQSVNVNSLLGYHLQVSGTLTKNAKTELFAINSEVVKSFN